MVTIRDPQRAFDGLEDLRWYLEDYLRAPYGVYGDRGPMIEASLGVWGAMLRVQRNFYP